MTPANRARVFKEINMQATQTKRGKTSKQRGNHFRWLGAVAMLALVAACGGGGDSGSGGGPAPTYTVSGTVSGMRFTSLGIALKNNGGNDLAVPFNGAFSFTTALASGSAYNVTIAIQATNPAQTCTVSNGSGTIGSSNVTNVRIDCPYATAYAIGGTVDGLTGTNLNLGYAADNLSRGLSSSANANGTFSIPGSITSAVNGTHYTLTVFTQPTNPDQHCAIANGSGTVASADVTNVAVTCESFHAVGGTISGLIGTNLVLGYTADNTGNTPTVTANANGAFAFPAGLTGAVSGTHYTVAVVTQPTNPAQNCTVGSGSGTVTNADVTSVRVTCAPPSVPIVCVPPIGAGTTHGSINAAQTWTAAASPHIVPFDINLNAPVTVEACAVVRIVGGGTVTINPNGALIAAGAPDSPVTIERQVAGAAWSSIRNLGGTLSLTHAIVRGGGDPLNTLPAYAGALHMQTTGVVATLHVDDVEIADSLSQGVYINGDVGFDATSQNLRVHGSAGYPVHVYARVIGSIPTGTYTGNGHDAIAIAGAGGPVLDAQTMHDRGVPYHVGSGADGGRMDVSTQLNGPAAALTIEPGVTIQFPPGGTLNVDASAHGGALIAIGGPGAQQIVFTSDQGALAKAGDWLGIVFNDPVEGQNVMQNVRVEFGGGEVVGNNTSCPYPGRVGVNYAAIRIFGPPQSQFITNSEIFASARDGIDRGWRDDFQPDFLGTNTFNAVAGCKQTMPRTSNGVCPVTPACP
jgi:hypothetical protein